MFPVRALFLERHAASPIRAELEVLRMRCRESLGHPEFVLPVTAGNSCRLETLPQPVQRLPRICVPPLRKRFIPGALPRDDRGANRKPWRSNLVLHAHLERLSAIRHGTELAGKIKPDAGKVLEERVHAKKRRPLDMRVLA